MKKELGITEIFEQINRAHKAGQGHRIPSLVTLGIRRTEQVKLLIEEMGENLAELKEISDWQRKCDKKTEIPCLYYVP